MSLVRIAQFLLLSSLLAGCAGGAQFVKPSGEAVSFGNQSYRLGKVQLAFDNSNDPQGLPNKQQVKQIFTNKLKEQLIAQGISGSGLNVDLVIEYDRSFAGEAFGQASGWGPAYYGYTVNVRRSSETVGTLVEPRKMQDKGMFGNLASVGGWFSGLDPKQEVADIQLIAKEIVGRIKAANR